MPLKPLKDSKMEPIYKQWGLNPEEVTPQEVESKLPVMQGEARRQADAFSAIPTEKEGEYNSLISKVREQEKSLLDDIRKRTMTEEEAAKAAASAAEPGKPAEAGTEDRESAVAPEPGSNWAKVRDYLERTLDPHRGVPNYANRPLMYLIIELSGMIRFWPYPILYEGVKPNNEVEESITIDKPDEFLSLLDEHHNKGLVDGEFDEDGTPLIHFKDKGTRDQFVRQFKEKGMGKLPTKPPTSATGAAPSGDPDTATESGLGSSTSDPVTIPSTTGGSPVLPAAGAPLAGAVPVHSSARQSPSPAFLSSFYPQVPSEVLPESGGQPQETNDGPLPSYGAR